MLRRHFLSSISTIALGAGTGLLPAGTALACGDCDNYVPRKKSNAAKTNTGNRTRTKPAIDPIGFITGIGAINITLKTFTLFMDLYFEYLLTTWSYHARLEHKINSVVDEIKKMPSSNEGYRSSEGWARRQGFSDAEIAAFGASLKKAKSDWNSFDRALRARKRALKRYNPGLRVLTPKAQAIVDRKLAAKKRRIDAILADLKKEKERIKALRAKYDAIDKLLRDETRELRRAKRFGHKADVRAYKAGVQRAHSMLRKAERELQRAVDKAYMAQRKLADITKLPIKL